MNFHLFPVSQLRITNVWTICVKENNSPKANSAHEWVIVFANGRFYVKLNSIELSDTKHEMRFWWFGNCWLKSSKNENVVQKKINCLNLIVMSLSEVLQWEFSVPCYIARNCTTKPFLNLKKKKSITHCS